MAGNRDYKKDRGIKEVLDALPDAEGKGVTYGGAHYKRKPKPEKPKVKESMEVWKLGHYTDAREPAWVHVPDKKSKKKD